MRIKYSPDTDILLFALRDTSPVNAIAEPGGVIVSYDDEDEPVSIEFLNASELQLIRPGENNLMIHTESL